MTDTMDGLLAMFWEWRKAGRECQTLHQDLEIFLTAYQHRIGWQECGRLYRHATFRAKRLPRRIISGKRLLSCWRVFR